MAIKNGSCTGCGNPVAHADRHHHQALHDAARITGNPEHVVATMGIPKATDERTPLTAADIAARKQADHGIQKQETKNV